MFSAAPDTAGALEWQLPVAGSAGVLQDLRDKAAASFARHLRAHCHGYPWLKVEVTGQCRTYANLPPPLFAQFCRQNRLIFSERGGGK